MAHVKTVLRFDGWATRFYVLNAIVVAVVLSGFMVMFGLLSGSLIAGLTFPMALLSMAWEHDVWGLWMLSPIYLLPALMVARSGHWGGKAARSVIGTIGKQPSNKGKRR